MQPSAQYHDLVRRDIFPLLPEDAGRVLDFGGGVGATSGTLRSDARAQHAVLFDQIADNAVENIDASEPLDLNDIERIGEALDRHGPFDTVLCLDILEHLLDPWAVVKRLDQAVAPGGIMIVSLPNMSHFSVVGPLMLRGRFEYQDKGVKDRTHLRWFTKSSAIELATCSSMVLEKVSTNISGRKSIYGNRATFGLFERFFVSQYKLRVRKPG